MSGVEEQFEARVETKWCVKCGRPAKYRFRFEYAMWALWLKSGFGTVVEIRVRHCGVCEEHRDTIEQELLPEFAKLLEPLGPVDLGQSRVVFEPLN